jgi:hypothetical protein
MEKKSFLAELIDLLAKHWPGKGWVLRRIASGLVPHPGTVIVTLLLVGVVLLIQNASATSSNAPNTPNSSTTTISYQGRLADSGGNPITSTVAIQFRLYVSNTGGSPLWNETHAAVPVENGLFHVLLGSVNPVPVNVLAANPTLWLGIAVGADSEMTPREQLASAPYAMIAGSVADGGITSRKLQLNHAQYHRGDFGTTTSTTPGDLSDVADLVTINLDTPQWVLIWYQTTASQSSGVVHYMALEFGGVLDSDTSIERSGTNGVMTGFVRKHLSAGQHTIKAKYWIGQTSQQAASYWRRRIMVVAVGQ